jgi:cytochrome c553
MKKLQIVFFLFSAVAFAIACNSSEPKVEQAQVKSKVADAKPMALMMRAIYDQSAEMRSWVTEGKALDSSIFRFMEFHKLEPTDSTVLVEVFYKHNADFKAAFEELIAAGADKEKYNAMLTQCVSCHEDFCPGPIKRINKLRIES